MKNKVNPLVKLALDSVESYVNGGKVLSAPKVLAPEMKDRAGVFVCLKKDGELRGCVGTILPTTPNVATEIIKNSIAAATDDPRFDCVGCHELDGLKYSVDVLMQPEPVKDLKDLDPKRYGVIVQTGARRGLLLPDLDGVDTVEEQISIAKHKAGIASYEPVTILRFEVKRYE